MSGPVRELSHRLSEDAEAVCRRYLFNGRRCGNYWLVGDINNTPGRSLFVRLKGDADGRGAAGKWVDYVALLVMLRIADCALSYGRVTAFQQHNFACYGRWRDAP